MVNWQLGQNAFFPFNTVAGDNTMLPKTIENANSNFEYHKCLVRNNISDVAGR